MNQDLSQIATYYSIKSHAELSKLLLEKSKDNLISIITDLLTAYINDRNSSTLREFVTVSIAGYEHTDKKLGYNGFKQSSAIGSNPIACEAKPQNIQTDGYDLKKSKPKLEAGGSFNDYTEERLRKDLRENPNILASGFIDGHLQYILEFPFSALKERFEELIKKRWKGKKRKTGEYIRGASFNFNHIKKHNSLRIIYKNIESIHNNEKYFQKELYQFLVTNE